MFDFEEPEDGSEERYHERIRWWTVIDPNKKSMPRAQHHFWWLLHNLVAHTAIGLVPIKATFDFHDWTSRRLNGAGRVMSGAKKGGV